MTVELPQEVSGRLESDLYGWLTTVAKSGQPVPRLVWFYFDGSALTVYSQPTAAKIRHIENHPLVSLNLDSDGNGDGVVGIGGRATVTDVDVDPRSDEQYWGKYREDAERFGLSEAMATYSTRLTISIERVWTTPAG
jgi:PPOX class probable F420-dependent enzyme